MLFLSLDSFLHTGGLEKFNCCFLKALQELSSEAQVNAKAASMYDISCDEKYFSKKNYKAYNGKKWLFVLQSIIAGLKCNTLILGHVNLALIGIAVKKLNPSIKLILIVHGIDIWQQQTGLKKKLLEITDEVWSVSNYTKHVLLQNNCYVKAEKIRIFPNTIDPFFSLPKKFDKPAYLLQRYGIKANTKVIVTVTRLTSTEKFKGYDNIIAILKSININSAEPIHYILCGKTDIAELNRINQLIKQFNAEAYITLTGFVKDEELTDHYLLADVFVLPSKKEGFGIVFIEAMACGLPVIAGNKDGSVDALMNGELGTLIDPDNEFELLNAIIASLNNETHNPLALQQKVVANFGFHQYKQRLKTYLEINN
jgi:glycosyltransferase involved in cell wall biosynthesis